MSDAGARVEGVFASLAQVEDLLVRLLANEIRDATGELALDACDEAVRILGRALRTIDLLAGCWAPLAAMTPTELATIRPVVIKKHTSITGVHRELETAISGRPWLPVERLYRSRAGEGQESGEVSAEPCLYGEALRVLARSGLPIPRPCLQRDLGQPYQPSADVAAAWLTVYQYPEVYPELLRLAQALVAVAYALVSWRYQHLTMTDRLIGRGTDLSSGHRPPARSATPTVMHMFPELWEAESAV